MLQNEKKTMAGSTTTTRRQKVTVKLPEDIRNYTNLLKLLFVFFKLRFQNLILKHILCVLFLFLKFDRMNLVLLAVIENGFP